MFAHWRKHAAIAAKFTLSIGLTLWVLRQVDFELAMVRLRAISAIDIAVTALLMLAQILHGVVRWWWVLRAMNGALPMRNILRIIFAGLFFNQVLPSSVGGDVVRAFLAKRAGLPLHIAVSSVMAERALTVFGLAVMGAVLAPLLAERVAGLMPYWLLPALALAGLLGGALVLNLHRLPPKLLIWRGFSIPLKLVQDFHAVMWPALPALILLLLIVAGHVLYAITVYVLAQGLNIPLALIDSVLLVPPILLLTALPISIAGWGIREGAMVAALGLIGIPGESALALSLLLGIMTMLLSLPGGIVWALSKDKQADILSEVKATEAHPGNPN